MNKRFFWLLVPLILLPLFTSLIIVQLYLLSHNTLENNGNWISIKRQVRMPLLGANNYYKTKVALRQSRLDLGAWHGFQGVIYKKPVNPASIEFDFKLTDGAYFYFVFNKTDEAFSGIRISNHDAFAHILVSAKNSGEFTEKTALHLDGIKKNEWNQMRVAFNANGFSLFINEVHTGDFNESLDRKQYFGFRGSYKSVFIDNITVREKGSNVIFRESFNNKKNSFRAWVLTFLILILINAAIALLLNIRKTAKNNMAFTLILMNLLVLIMSATFLLFYYYVNEIKTRYPDIHGLFRNLMKREMVYVNRDAEYVDRRIMNQYSIQAEKDVYRILFIGTSQTRGAGAETKSDVFVKVTEKLLNNNGTERYECINAGVHGTNSTELLRYYKDRWIKLKPDAVLINLSNNDGDTAMFRSNLQQFIDLNSRAEIRTILVLEANSMEVETSLLEFHEVMREIGRINQVPVIDLHEYLIDKYDSGILWWDGVHMTSYGQQLTGEFISGRILFLLDR